MKNEKNDLHFADTPDYFGILYYRKHRQCFRKAKTDFKCMV